MNLSLASPIWLWMGLVALPIVLCYILRVQPRRYQVTTLMFWDKVIEDTKRRAWWQSLRRWLSLALQLLFIGLLIGAMIDPILGRSEKARDLVLVIDRSASMNAGMTATEIGPSASTDTRFDAAIRRAMSLAGELRGGDTMAVIAAGGSIEVVAGRGDFAPSIVDAIETVRPTDGPTRLEEAVELARRIAPDEDRRQVIVLTDRLPASPQAGVSNAQDESDPDEKLADSPGDVVYETFGESHENWAITTMSSRRSLSDPVGFATRFTIKRFVKSPNDTGQDDPDETAADSQATDSGVRVNLRLIGFDELDTAPSQDSPEVDVVPKGQLIDVIPVNLDSDNEMTWTVEATSAAGGVLVAELDFGGRASVIDALSADNVARVVIPPRPDVPVRLVGGTDPAVEAESEENASIDAGLFFLRSVLSSIPTLTVVENDESFPSDGLTVWYRVGEEEQQLPDGPLLVLSPQIDGPEVNGQPSWTIGDNLESPLVAKTSETSPLMRHVRMTNVTLGNSRDLTIADAFGISETLVQTADDSVVATSIERTGDAAGNRVMILATELASSDFPLRIAFPVMMTNAVNWFTGRDSESPVPLRAGVASSVRVAGAPGFRLSDGPLSVT
ncbi:MAG: BatA and WFA domain-containing protein, partial [Planctomycetota bacterium]